MQKIKLYKKIPCLFGRHKQAKKSIRLDRETYEYFGKELIYCERCLKILAIGHYPPYHPNCLCEIIPEYYDHKVEGDL